MDVIIMPSIASLVSSLATSYPTYTFTADDHFRWSADTLEITYDPHDTYAKEHLLHELAHALLGHSEYDRDIQLIAMERDAWHHAQKELGTKHGITIADTIVQDSLDTYRDWLHARSTCPGCQATGIQSKKQHYRCIACQRIWRVNEARVCGLRRYSIMNH